MNRLGRGIRRTLAVAGGVVAALLCAAVAALFVLTSTEWGHQRVRGLALRALRGPVNGIVRIGRIDGDLTHQAVFTDVAITDSAGHLFLSARHAEVRYDLRDLFHQRIDFHHLRLDHPVVVLVQSADGVWNFDRVFRRSTGPMADKGPTTSNAGGTGWGSWIAASNAQVIDGDLTVRSPWRPDSSLTGAARDSAIRVALGPESRQAVTAAPDGYEKTFAAHAVNATISPLRLADPNDPVKFLRVTSLTTDLAAFRPPDAAVRNVVGTFYFTGDSLWFPHARVALPGSRVRGAGEYAFAAGNLRLQLQADPAALADLRFLYPRLPTDGAGTAGVEVTWRGRSQTYLARHLDLHSGPARASGTLGLTVADSLVFHETDVRFSAVDTRLIEQLWPGLRIPRQGVATGRAKLAGPMTALTSDVDLTFDDQTAGRSRVQAVGVVGLAGGFRAQRLALTLDPLQVALARGAVTSLPVGGTITGRATVDGSTDDSLVASADLVHRQGDSYTHMVATGDVAFAPAAPATPPSDRDRPVQVRVTSGRTARPPAASTPATLRDRAGRVNLSARFDTVDLGLITKFVPAARLAGRSSGAVRVSGDLHDLAVHSELDGIGSTDSSALTVDGHLDLASRIIGYDLTASAHRFDVHAVSPQVPPTSITATASARGRGTTPATMDADLSADVGASAFDSLAVDTAHVRARITGGQLRLDTARVRALATTAEVQGSIGVATGHDGELQYRVAIDSLQSYRRFLPPDTAAVAPRPARVADAVRQARADSARQASATDVERAIRGAPAPALAVDSPATLRRDALAGRALATGTVHGTIQRFDLRGNLAADSVVAVGNAARRVQAEYQWTGGPSLSAPVSGTLRIDSASLAGFAFDSIAARIDYHRPDGSLRLFVRQSDDGEYVANTHFLYSPTAKEVRYDTLALRFDTTLWRAPHPGSVQWGADGLTVRDVELTDGRAGQVTIDGTVPTTPRASASLHVTMRDFEIGDLATLAESDLPVRGRLALRAVVTGTANDLRLRGNASLSSASIRQLPLPSAYLTYQYDTTALTTHIELSPRGAPSTPFAVAQAVVPVDLSLHATGSRLPDRPVAADIRLDSLPLDVLPQFTQSVLDVGGRVSGHLTIGGTLRDPDPRGTLAVDRGSTTIVSTGTALRDMVARLHLTGDSATIDSLVARTPATGGWLRVAGVLDRTDPAVLVLNVALTANRARVMNTRDRGRIDVDANLILAGPTVAPFVSGNATVLSGVLYLPEPDNKRLISLGDPTLHYVADTSRPAVRRAIPESVTLLASARMDVDVTVNRNVWVRNKDANVEAFSADPIIVTIDRTRQAIVVDGTLTTDRGEYSLMSKRFTINKGTATFIGTPELNPSIQAQGEYDVAVPGREALAIQVNIGGSLDSLRLSLTSNAQPPISQSDLFSYLAFNQNQSTSLTSVSNGSVVGVASSFVSDQLAGQAMGVLTDQVKGDLARALDADVLAITTGNVYTDIGQNRNAAAFFQNTQLEFGKYFTPQTFVAVQASVAPGAQIIHRVGNNLSINLSAQPLYLLGPPTLSTTPNTPLTAVFGLALARTWRF